MLVAAVTADFLEPTGIGLFALWTLVFGMVAPGVVGTAGRDDS